MKNRYLSIGLAASIIFNIYLMSVRRDLVRENKTLTMNEKQVDIVETKKSAIKKVEKTKESLAEPKKLTTKESIEADMVSNPTMYTGLPTEEEIIESQEKWRDNVSEFFITSLDLRESDVDKYFEIKKSREKELSLFLTERIRSQGSFIYTLEDMVDENKINEKYLNHLKKLMGEQGYNAYRSFRDSHNQQMIESQQMHSLIEL